MVWHITNLFGEKDCWAEKLVCIYTTAFKFHPLGCGVFSQNMLVIRTYWATNSHCLYMGFDGKKLATSNLPFQAFEGFIGT